jgi:6-pyruvoyltetrahydropterin/6-carboxytetrahydropterin synthase
VILTTLTRKYHFSASHRLHTAALSETENARVFGKCNNPYGHGHDYELEVTLNGRVNADTGQIVPIERLDDYVRERVLARFSNRYLNVDVWEFRNLVPTTENVLIVITRLLEQHWTERFGNDGPSLARIHVQETGRNGFELDVADFERNVDAEPERASVQSELHSRRFA